MEIQIKTIISDGIEISEIVNETIKEDLYLILGVKYFVSLHCL